MAFVVAHFTKVRTAAGLSAVAHHNQRLAVYDAEGRVLDLPEYITHPERQPENILQRFGVEAVHADRHARIKEANLKRKPQKNAAVAIEAILSASPEWFEGRDIAEVRDFFMTSAKYLDERFGAKNKLHLAVHFDETTPHLHALFVPIVEGRDGAKYSSGTFLGGREGLRQIQEDIAKAVARFGLERGTEGSKARHTNQQQWSKALKNKERELDIREAAVVKKEAEVIQHLAVVNSYLAAIDKDRQKKIQAEATRLQNPGLSR